MKSTCAALLVCLIVPATAHAQSNQSIASQLDTISAKLDALQAAVDALKPPAPKSTTSMLFPFATSQAGFDTAIAVSNTLDGTGTCTVTFYGPGVWSPLTTPSIPAGGMYTFLVSEAAPGFQGFVRVDCNFPRARGWGFLSDIGARTLATTIDAEILP